MTIIKLPPTTVTSSSEESAGKQPISKPKKIRQKRQQKNCSRSY
jgi:hypothetical protein